MNDKKILFPVDLAEASAIGLAAATALARDLGATLLILHVQEFPLAYAAGDYPYGPPETSSEALWAALNAVVPTDPQVACQHRLELGAPAEEILRVASEEHPDLIVIGTHGRSGLKRLLLGSVAEAVVRRASCPVITYRAAWKLPQSPSKSHKSPLRRACRK